MTNKGTLISIGNDASPREVTTRISGTWTTPVSITGTTGDETRVRHLTEQLWFTINANDNGIRAHDFGP